MLHPPCRTTPLLAFLALGAAPALAEGDWFETSAGARAPTPAIETLDCRQMVGVLTEIDDTGYRRGAAAPDHEGDLDLLRYENRLARRYFAECVGSPVGGATPDGAFSSGYDGASGAPGRR